MDESVRNMNSLLLTKQQTSSILNTSMKKIDRLTADGSLHIVKLGKRKSGRVRDNRPCRYKLTEVLALAGMSIADYQSLDTLLKSGVEK